MTLLPTHTCFDDALEYCEHRVKQDRRLVRSNKLTLVHGVLTVPEGPKRGQPFAHAWVEEGGRVWQDGFLEDGTRVTWSMDRKEFAEKLGLQKETRYTLLEALAENDRSGTYGPWLPEYQALCGNGETFWPLEVAS